MSPFLRRRVLPVVVLWLVIAPVAVAIPVDGRMIASDVMRLFAGLQIEETILEAAKSLFWSLATISLVWTMGMLIVRQDIGEMLMELLRFIVVTGLFYWILVNASSRQGGEGFVDDIIRSFLQMISGSDSDKTIRTNADDVLTRGLTTYIEVMNTAGEAQDGDRLIAGGMAVAILCISAAMAAQFILALVMAWILSYAGIFLLGFGGARWTSPIAVNYYKHVVAVGAALLVISALSAITKALLEDLGFDTAVRTQARFDYLGLLLTVSVLMLVLAIKIPQMIYTLVTGSVLGIYAGSASAAGTAIVTGGGSAYAAAVGRVPGGGGGGGGGGFGGGSAAGSPVGSGTSLRAESVMDAVQRSASVAGGMADPFHVSSGADPFGVGRAPDPHRNSGRGRSVFGDVQAGTASTTSAASMLDTTPDPANTPGNATSKAGVQSGDETTRSAPKRSVVGHANTQTSFTVAAEPVHADAIETGSRGVEGGASVIDQRGPLDHGSRSVAGVADHGTVGSDIPVSTEVGIHREGSPKGSVRRVEASTVRAPYDAAASHATNNRSDILSGHGSAIDVHSVGTPLPEARSEQTQPIGSAHATMPSSESHIDKDMSVSAASKDGMAKSATEIPRTRQSPVATSAVMRGTPDTSTVQQDLRSDAPIAESVEVLPGATTAPPAPDAETRADPTPTDATEAQPPRRRKRRVRRWPDEDQPASLPPIDGMPDTPAPYGDEKAQDDPT